MVVSWRRVDKKPENDIYSKNLPPENKLIFFWQEVIFKLNTTCNSMEAVLHILSAQYYRSSHRRCSVNKTVLRNFAKFTGKHLCQSLFLLKLQTSVLRPATLLKKRLWHRCFLVNFAKFLRTPF